MHDMLSAGSGNVDCIQVCTTVQHLAHASPNTFVAALTDCRQGNVHSMWYIAGPVVSVETYNC